MPRILICTILMTALFGGLSGEPLAALRLTGPEATDPEAALAIPTGLAVRHGSNPVGETPGRQFGWPLAGSPTVVRAFHPPTFRYGPGHRGVDLAAVPEAPVLAAGAGTVVFAGIVASRRVISVDHPGGLRTTYEPVSPMVTAGDRVIKGQRIGTVALDHPGCPVSVCLHWGVLRGPARDGDYLDPLRLLATGRVRLLPVDGLPYRQRCLRPSPGGGFQHLAPQP
ncbi:MAG: M23 family metallopeptidase [Pseudonocardiaceae bacterium]